MTCVICSVETSVENAEVRQADLREAYELVRSLRDNRSGEKVLPEEGSYQQGGVGVNGQSNLPVCDKCSTVLLEVLRLGRVIQELTKTQLNLLSLLPTVNVPSEAKPTIARKIRIIGPLSKRKPHAPIVPARDPLEYKSESQITNCPAKTVSLKSCSVRLLRLDQPSSRHVPSTTSKVKEEPVEYVDWNEDDHFPQDTDESEYDNDTRNCTAVLRSTGTTQVNLSRIVYLPDDMYLVEYIVFKFDREARIYACLEQGCGKTITGSHLDSSVFQNLRRHVASSHHDAGSSLERLCLVCSKSFNGLDLQKWRMHMVRDHSCRSVHKNVHTVICEECGGRPIQNVDHRLHIWTHRNFEDKMAAYRAGETVPAKMRRSLGLNIQNTKKTPGKKLAKAPQSKKTLQVVSPSIIENRNPSFDDTPYECPIQAKTRPVLIKRKAKGDRGFKTVDWDSQRVYKLAKTTLLYKFTTLSSLENHSKLICNEPRCGRTFIPSTQQAPWDVLDQAKIHIDTFHEKFYAVAWTEEASSKRICPYCTEWFYRGDLFRRHIFKNHLPVLQKETRKRVEVICEVCGMNMGFSPTTFQYHHQSHMNTDEKLALKSSSGPRKRRSQIALDPLAGSSNDQFPCKQCDKVFTNIKYLRCHLLSHADRLDRRRWDCPKCSREFLSSVAVRRHIQRVHNPELLHKRPCPIEGCTRTFNVREGYPLKMHLATVHKRDESWVCETCGKIFYSQIHLRCHIVRVHKIGNRKGPCEICGKVLGLRFMKYHKLKMHSDMDMT